MAELYNTLVPRTDLKGKLRKFDNIVTVVKTGYGNYVCTDPTYANDSACIQAALDYISSLGGGTLYLQGHFICPTQLLYTGSNLTVIGDDANTVLDFSTAGSTVWAIYVHGALSTTNALLASNGSVSNHTITVASGEGTKFAAGDWIRVRSEQIYHDILTSRVKKHAEIQQISSVAGDVITLKESLLMNYLTSYTATVDLVTMREQITFRDFKIVGLSTHQNLGIVCEYCYDVKIENVTSVGMVVLAIRLDQVVCGNVEKCTISGSNKDQLGYGIAVVNACRNITGTKNKFSDCRHGIACGGDWTYGVQFNQIYTDNIQSYDRYGAGMFGMHNSYDGLIVSNNTCNGGRLGYFEANNNIITENIFHDVTGGDGILLGVYVDGAVISGNIGTLVSNGAGVQVNDGSKNITIDHNRINSHVYSVRLEGKCENVIIDGNVLTSTGDTTIQVTNASDSVGGASHVSIVNNTIHANGFKCIDIGAGYYDINTIKIADNDCITAGTSYPCIQLGGDAAGLYTINKAQIKGNQCDGGSRGIALLCTDDAHVMGNHIQNATTGILISSAYASCVSYTVENNKISDCTTAVTDQAAAADGIVRNNS
jgi:hypothetical protein